MTAVYTLDQHRRRVRLVRRRRPRRTRRAPGSTASFAKSNDVDWYRFKLTATTRMRLALGDLTTGGQLDLYQKLLDPPADLGSGRQRRRGDHPAACPAGTYAVRLSGSGTGSHATAPRPHPQDAGTGPRCSSTNPVEGSTLRLVGELYNNTTKTRRVDQGHGQALQRLERAARDAHGLRRPDLHAGRQPGAVPDRRVAAGRVPPCVFTVSSAATTRSIGAPTPRRRPTARTAAITGRVAGTVKNRYTTSVTHALGGGDAVRRPRQRPGCGAGQRRQDDAGRRQVARPSVPPSSRPASPRTRSTSGACSSAEPPAPPPGRSCRPARSAPRRSARRWPPAARARWSGPGPGPVGRPVTGSVARAVSAR